jgi:hypothetical protein
MGPTLDGLLNCSRQIKLCDSVTILENWHNQTATLGCYPMYRTFGLPKNLARDVCAVRTHAPASGVISYQGL